MTGNPATRINVFTAIDKERVYQETKWCDTTPASIGEFVLYIDDYVTQAKHQLTRSKTPGEGRNAALFTILKIAALATAALEGEVLVERVLNTPG